MCEEIIARGAMPLLKDNQIIVDDTSSHPPMTTSELAALTLKLLAKSEIEFEGYRVSGEEIVVEDREPRFSEDGALKIFICPHCGFTTSYEEEYWAHTKIHYLGF